MKDKTNQLIYIIIIIIFSFYLIYQIFNFLNTPKIELDYFPKNIEKEKIILSGKVTGLKEFYIFNQPVLLAPDFKFKKDIFLIEGLNIIALKGVTEKGKNIIKKIEIFYTKK